MKNILLILSVLFSFSNANELKKEKALFMQECSACHMAYQPQFLPKRSWVKLMDNLENHFESDASLDKQDVQMIMTFLENYSSDSANKAYGDIGKFARSISKYDTPIAISKTPKFIREHNEIPSRFIKQEEVKSFANCTACHTDAKKGWYHERNIYIPNYGRWDN